MELNMYNVQFGDCFLLDEPKAGQALLVDFGSDTPDILDSVADKIAKRCDGRELSVLLTHFHQDHINGFWKSDLPNQVNVRTVYLPNIMAMRETATQLDFLQLEVLRNLLSSVVLERRPAEITLYTLLNKLVKAGSRAVFLQRGCTFDLLSARFQVLWPDFSVLNIHPRVEKGFVSLLEELGLLGNLDRSLYEESRRVRIEPVDHFIDRLTHAYALLAEGGAELVQEALPALGESLEEMERYVRVRVGAPSNALLARLRERMAAAKRQGNRLSIVFQDEAVGGSSRLLMTGDATAPDLRRIINHKVENFPGFSFSHKYTAIKAPHHGTDSHFLPDLPDCQTILVSNGKPAPRHLGWGKISYLYGGFYHSHRGCEIQCTNPRCRLIQMARIKRCAFCKGFKQPSPITVSLP